MVNSFANNHLGRIFSKNKNSREGVLHAGFTKHLTPREFQVLLHKLHQIRDRPRRFRACRNQNRRSGGGGGTSSNSSSATVPYRYPTQQEQDEKKWKCLNSKVPLMQPCWYLNVVGCRRLGDEAMLHLHLIPSTVIDLDLSCCNLSPLGIARICEYLKSPNQNVKRMILWGNQVGNEGAVAIAEMLTVNTKIEDLCIREDDPTEKEQEANIDTRIGRVGWIALGKALAVNTTLQKFDFAHCGFENKDLLALGAGLRKNTGLELLNLRMTAVTDVGIRLYVLRRILEENITLRDISIPVDFITHDEMDDISRETLQELGTKLRSNKIIRQAIQETGGMVHSAVA